MLQGSCAFACMFCFFVCILYAWVSGWGWEIPSVGGFLLSLVGLPSTGDACCTGACHLRQLSSVGGLLPGRGCNSRQPLWSLQWYLTLHIAGWLDCGPCAGLLALLCLCSIWTKLNFSEEMQYVLARIYRRPSRAQSWKSWVSRLILDSLTSRPKVPLKIHVLSCSETVFYPDYKTLEEKEIWFIADWLHLSVLVRRKSNRIMVDNHPLSLPHPFVESQDQTCLRSIQRGVFRIVLARRWEVQQGGLFDICIQVGHALFEQTKKFRSTQFRIKHAYRITQKRDVNTSDEVQVQFRFERVRIKRDPPALLLWRSVKSRKLYKNYPPQWVKLLHCRHWPAVVQVPFTQNAEVLANAACKKWNTLLPKGCSQRIASNIKGFACKFACKPAYASCVNWAFVEPMGQNASGSTSNPDRGNAASKFPVLHYDVYWLPQVASLQLIFWLLIGKIRTRLRIYPEN